MKKKNGFTLLLMTMLLFVFAGSASAANNKTKAMKAYKKFLSQPVISVTFEDGEVMEYPANELHFSVVYLNNDNVPELIVYWAAGGQFSDPFLFTYKNNKVILGSVIYPYSAGRPTRYYQKKNVLVSEQNGERYYRKFKNNKRNAWYSTRVQGVKQGMFVLARDISSGEVSAFNVVTATGQIIYDPYFTAKQFKSYLNKCVGNYSTAKMTKITYCKNSAGNRNRYLK